MRGHEFTDAVEALAKVDALRHARAETIYDAVAAVFAWVGARRVRLACSNDPEGAADRRLIGELADLEDAAARLDAIPSRGATLARRREAWADCLRCVARVRRLLDIERVTGRAETA